MIWVRFYCVSCGWETVGSYDKGGLLPDTDCPKCGSHDAVRDTETEVPAPSDVEAVRRDQDTGPYANKGAPR